MFTSLSPSPLIGKLKHKKAAGSATAFHYSYHFRLWIKVELYRGSAATRLWLCQASHMPGPQSSPNCAWSSSILGPKAAPTVPGPPPSWDHRQPQLCQVLLHPRPQGTGCAWAPFRLGPDKASTVPAPARAPNLPHLCQAPLQPRPKSSPNCAWSSSILGPKAAPTVPGPPPSWAPKQPQLCLVLLHPRPQSLGCAGAPSGLGPEEASTVLGPAPARAPPVQPQLHWSSSILGPNTAPTEPASPPSWAPPVQPQLHLVLLHPGSRGSTCAWASFLLGPHEASTVPGPLQPGPRGHHCAGPPSGTGPAPSPAPCGQLCSLPAWFLFSLHSSRLTG